VCVVGVEPLFAMASANTAVDSITTEFLLGLQEDCLSFCGLPEQTKKAVITAHACIFTGLVSACLMWSSCMHQEAQQSGAKGDGTFPVKEPQELHDCM
jgi:hypothetical protein